MGNVHENPGVANSDISISQKYHCQMGGELNEKYTRFFEV